MQGSLGCRVMVCITLLGCGGDPTSETSPSAGKPAPPATAKPKVDTRESPTPAGTMEMVGDVGLVPLALPGIDGLSGKDKQQLVDGYLSVKHAETVYLSRLGPEAERARRILAGIIEAGESVPGGLRDKIVPYAERFVLHGGPVDAWTREKFLPTFIPGELAAAAEKAIQRGVDLGEKQFDGADLGANRLEQLEAFLNSIRPLVFGKPAVGTPPATAEDTDGLRAETTETRDAETLSRVAASLRPDEGQGGGDALGPAVGAILSNGDDTLFLKYLREWLKGDEVVTHLMGYVFPGGDFGGFVAVRDSDRTPMVRKVAAEAAHFERHLPGNAMFRRPPKQIPSPNVGAYHLVGGFGAMGPLPRQAFSLPLPRFDKGQAGPRTLVFTNVLDAEVGLLGKQQIQAFSPSEEVAFRRVKWQSTGSAAFLILKHVIGFQAGTRPAVRTASAPAPIGGELDYGETCLEALHADLVALYFALDPKTEAIGLVPEVECGHAIYDEYVSRFVEQSVPLPSGDVPVRPELMARRIAVRYAIEKGAVVVDAKEGHFFASVVSHDALRLAIGWLLAEVQRMVSVNDLESFNTLMERYGGPPPRSWQEDVSSRLAALGLPAKRAIVYPGIVAKRDADGNVVDVTLRYPTPLKSGLMPGQGVR